MGHSPVQDGRSPEGGGHLNDLAVTHDHDAIAREHRVQTVRNRQNLSSEFDKTSKAGPGIRYRIRRKPPYALRYCLP
jgi:hypothetical protein